MVRRELVLEGDPGALEQQATAFAVGLVARQAREQGTGQGPLRQRDRHAVAGSGASQVERLFRGLHGFRFAAFGEHTRQRAERAGAALGHPGLAEAVHRASQVSLGLREVQARGVRLSEPEQQLGVHLG